MFFFPEILEVRALKLERRRARKWVPLGFSVPPPGPEKEIPDRLQRVGPKSAAQSVLVFRTRASPSVPMALAPWRIGTALPEWGMFVYRAGTNSSATLPSRTVWPHARSFRLAEDWAVPIAARHTGGLWPWGKPNRPIHIPGHFRQRTLLPSVIRKTLPALPLLLLQHLCNAMATVRLDVRAQQSDVRGNETARQSTPGAKPRKRNRMLDSPYGMHLPIFPACDIDKPTEDRLERIIERLMDRADKALLSGKATQVHTTPGSRR
ncbi:hypothetical protein NLM33_18660 [Bradyrhizobium sp. CCGUVB1N3]|uniref:hypothetical protein n=1 Tax=Bradyrhizobium sp. CCGUVB1N3 TaxID=2949629 RepID=UPI0020B2BCAC|nr:hypothetical protein [Bradyrhizobium sp. CCGUVB1N3]MCP3472340.1 hypothetical protein [Bradyrhizobium sp. CCGUVB1N3]